MPAPIWLALGALLATGFVLLVRRRGVRHELRPLAIGLVVAATIYLAAAVLGLDATGTWMEGLGVVAFGAAALAGLRWPLVLAAGWAAHVAWDAALHLAIEQPYIGAWYAWLCLGFDPVVAGYLGWSARGR